MCSHFTSTNNWDSPLIIIQMDLSSIWVGQNKGCIMDLNVGKWVGMPHNSQSWVLLMRSHRCNFQQTHRSPKGSTSKGKFWKFAMPTLCKIGLGMQWRWTIPTLQSSYPTMMPTFVFLIRMLVVIPPGTRMCIPSLDTADHGFHTPTTLRQWFLGPFQLCHFPFDSIQMMLHLLHVVHWQLICRNEFQVAMNVSVGGGYQGH